jgi:hypothetical protein
MGAMKEILAHLQPLKEKKLKKEAKKKNLNFKKIISHFFWLQAKTQ